MRSPCLNPPCHSLRSRRTSRPRPQENVSTACFPARPLAESARPECLPSTALRDPPSRILQYFALPESQTMGTNRVPARKQTQLWIMPSRRPARTAPRVSSFAQYIIPLPIESSREERGSLCAWYLCNTPRENRLRRL